MTQWMISLFLLTFGSIALAQPSEGRAIVLVPGTLNSGIPDALDSTPATSPSGPYFSKAIVDTLKERTPHVLVIKNLRMVGDLKWNGEQVLTETRAWYEKEFPEGDVPITFIAHSAGAFYTLWANHLNEQRRTEKKPLPFQSIIMLSAPLKGAEVADLLFFNQTWNQRLERALAELGPCFDFRGLLQLTTARVNEFFAELKIRQDLKLYAVAFQQEMPTLLDDPFNSQFLSPPLAVTDWFIGEKSDGLVSVTSAEAQGLILSDSKQQPVSITLVRHLPYQLDHLEQVLDVSFFAATGFKNLEAIRETQKSLYNGLYNLP